MASVADVHGAGCEVARERRDAEEEWKSVRRTAVREGILLDDSLAVDAAGGAGGGEPLRRLMGRFTGGG